MAEDNLKSWAVAWLLIGFFTFSLLSFVLLFPIYQGRGDIYSGDSAINNTINRLETNFDTAQNKSNINLNLTADYNPETSESGSDYTQIGQAWNTLDFVTSIKDTIFLMVYYVLGSVSGVIILIFSSIFIAVSVYYAIKFLRQGQ